VGLQYGTLLRPEIHTVYNEYAKLFGTVSGGTVQSYIFRIRLNRQVKALRAMLPNGFEDEIHGIADGSGIPFNDFMLFALTPELLFDTSCTSIIVRNNGELIHGRNFDFLSPGNFIGNYPVIVNAAVDGLVPYTSIGFAGLPGVYTGYNADGIAATVNTAAFAKHATKNVVPVGFLVKTLLENSSSLSDADTVMSRYRASHYFITVSSHKENDGAIYEDIGYSVTKVPMSDYVLYIANAPKSRANRWSGVSVISQIEGNLSRENTLKRLTDNKPNSLLSNWLLGILRNHDFYEYAHFGVHQSPIQDSLKTIDNYNTIQSVIIDWQQNRVLFSHGTCYAAARPYLSYDMTTKEISDYCSIDTSLITGSFDADTTFLDEAFTIAERTAMTPDEQGWKDIAKLLNSNINPFLYNDWDFWSSLNLRHYEEAMKAARFFYDHYTDYYLGSLYIGMVAYYQGNWEKSKNYCIESTYVPINSPAMKLLAFSYAALAEQHLGKKQEAKILTDNAIEILKGSWIPTRDKSVISKYIHQDEVTNFINKLF
jgi:tetratricopeptide (TPR) repeat protein